MPARSVFPTEIWHQKLELPRGFNDALARECYAFRELDAPGRRWSSRNYVAGYTSYSSICDLHERSPRFARLQRLIDREVARYARHLEMDLQGGGLRMSAFWINVMGRHAHHSFHLHPLSAVSGTYYVRVPRGSGGLKLEDPRIACYMGSPPRKDSARPANRRYVELSPREGEVLLFESWLKHEVPANRSAEDRISVSFNYDWASR